MKLVSMRNRAAWRRWLERNHAKADEVWLAYFKKHTGKATVGYAESVEEALCFGWIDGLKKRVDDDRYAHRFTPRREGSRWSALNVERAKKLIAAGRMTRAGLVEFERRKTAATPPDLSVFSLAPEYESRLRKNRKAAGHFAALPKRQREYYVAWIMSAKKAETRDKRFAEALSLLEAGRKLGMK